MEYVAQTGNPVPLRVADVHAARAELESKGVTFFGDTLDTGVCPMAMFAGPGPRPSTGSGSRPTVFGIAGVETRRRV